MEVLLCWEISCDFDVLDNEQCCVTHDDHEWIKAQLNVYVIFPVVCYKPIISGFFSIFNDMKWYEWFELLLFVVFH